MVRILNNKFEAVESYNYLGVRMTRKGSLRPHMDHMRKIVNYITNRLGFLKNRLPDRHMA